MNEKERMVKIIIGDIEHIDAFEEEMRIGVGKIRGETENEVEYCFIGKVYSLSYDWDLKEKVGPIREKEFSFWLPKNQIKIKEDGILLPVWLVREKNLYEYVEAEGRVLREINECVAKWKKIIEGNKK